MYMEEQDVIETRMSTHPDEPVFTEERSVVKQGDSLYCNLTDTARKITGLAEGDPLEIDIHRDKVVMRRARDE